MICKQCAKEINFRTDCVRYQKTTWKGAGRFAGDYEYEEEIPVDAGVFCSNQCLKNYMELGI